MVPACVLFARKTPYTVDDYQAVMAWMMAASILPTCDSRAVFGTRVLWKILVAAWAFLGCVIWLSEGYLYNLPGHFYFGVVLNVAFLIACKLCFRMATPVIIATNTVILLLFGVPIADLLTRPRYQLTTHSDANKKYYSYDIAKMDPATFARWWYYYRDQYDLLAGKVFTHKDGDVVPYRFIPNSRSPFFESVVSINSKGFRGREIPDQKADTYRIVALGESTTFGITLGAKDRPWPDLLEEMIRNRLNPERPVQVINAGVPGYTILDNLHRLEKDILPLNPDMIISYHGYNGFNLIDAALPQVRGHVPAYRNRPLRLLAMCEYRFKMMLYKRSQAPVTVHRPHAIANPLETEYANAYRQLIQCAQTNRISLALANFSMAVNGQSDSDVIEFYRLAFPSIISRIQANAVHSVIVKELGTQFSGVFFVDTHSNLDGHHDKFVDVMHFTQQGRQQIAENIFAGIREKLKEDLFPSQSSDGRVREMARPGAAR
jgi:lysophospholipase L1-like esterase